MTCLLDASDDVHSSLDALRAELRASNAEFRDAIYNIDTIVRALCPQNGVNISSLPLRTPTVPRFGAYPGTSSASSAVSNASTSSSSFHIGRMALEDVPGPSGIASEHLQTHGKWFRILKHM
jgi:hypothetical protein